MGLLHRSRALTDAVWCCAVLLCWPLQEGALPVQAAIQVAYSYSHCDYSPTQLVAALVEEVQRQPGLLEAQTLTT